MMIMDYNYDYGDADNDDIGDLSFILLFPL